LAREGGPLGLLGIADGRERFRVTTFFDHVFDSLHPADSTPSALTHRKCARKASKCLFVASPEMRACGAPT
jgi:hypothetical protein